MKKYEPKRMVASGRYQNYFPTLPAEIQQDVYGGLLIFALYPALPDQPPVSELQDFVQKLFMGPFTKLGKIFDLNRPSHMWLIDKVFRKSGNRDLKERGIRHLDLLYRVSMGGAAVIRFLATQDIIADKAIIDAGITPYPYPKLVCRLIALKDWVMIMLGTKSYFFMKLAAPPERWTPKGEDPEEHYRKIFAFEKNHFSSRTIYNVFWSANNYSMPDPIPHVETKIEYWYGEEEKKARKNNLAYTLEAFPQTEPKEFKGLAHAELVLMFPERFREEVIRFMQAH